MKAYLIRNKRTEKFVGPGLQACGPYKVWRTLGNARNAIAQAVNTYSSVRAKDYEIVEFTLTEGEVVE